MSKQASSMFAIVLALLMVSAASCFSKTDNGLSPEDERQTGELRENAEKIMARQIRLIPAPKQIKFYDEKPLFASGSPKVAIVLKNRTARGLIAANEIISRLKELNQTNAVPIVSGSEKDAYNIIIETEAANTFTACSNLPEECRKTDQSYGIFKCQEGIRLAGNGEMGMLYAAVTLRPLLVKKDGAIILHEADIIDWPDFKNRSVGTLWVQPGRGDAHDYIDWMFRMKINGSYRMAIGCVYQKSIPNTVIPHNRDAMNKAKILNDYARERGLVVTHGESTALGSNPDDKDRPGFDTMEYVKWAKQYFSFAHHDLHAIRADNIAALCNDTGFGQIFLHCRDGGGVIDPEHWGKRDKVAREMYKDNERGLADAQIYNIYNDALKKCASGVKLAGVFYPYSPNCLDKNAILKRLNLADDEEGRKNVADILRDLSQWAEQLNSHLDPSVIVCVREDSRERMLKYFDLFPGRAFYIYWAVGDIQLMPASIRYIRTAYRKENANDTLWIRDTYFSSGLLLPMEVAASEYLWNVNFPGASADYKPEYHDVGPEAQDALDILSERGAVGFFGVKAGKILKEVYRNGLSLSFIANPKEIASEQNIKEIVPLIKRHHLALLKADEAASAVWDIVKSDKNYIEPFSYPFFIQLLCMLKAAVAYSNFNLHEACFAQYLSDGKIDLAGKEILSRNLQ